MSVTIGPAMPPLRLGVNVDHVAATIRIATQPFMIGLASLLGVDSYLAPEPPRDPVVLGSSQVGRYNMVIQAPSLDPRLET